MALLGPHHRTRRNGERQGGWIEASLRRCDCRRCALDRQRSDHIVVRLSCVRLQRIFSKRNDNYKHLINAVFGDYVEGVNSVPDEKRDLLRARAMFVVEEYMYVFKTLRTTKLFTDPYELYALQKRIDKMCSVYVSAFGANSITNYIHDLQCGHVLYYLQQFQSLYIYCNIGLEATVGHTASKILHGTQRGGHGGGLGKKKTIVSSMKDHLTQKAVYAIGKISEKPPATYIVDMISNSNSSNVPIVADTGDVTDNSGVMNNTSNEMDVSD